MKSGIRDPKIEQPVHPVHPAEPDRARSSSSQVKAETGRKQALEPSRRRWGSTTSFTFVPRDTELPVMGGTVTQGAGHRVGLSSRPELAQAAAGVDAFRLEVCAQGKARGLQVPTLAAGSDLHARSCRWPCGPTGSTAPGHRPGDAGRPRRPERGPRRPGQRVRPPAGRGLREGGRPGPAGGGQRLPGLGGGDPARRRRRGGTRTPGRWSRSPGGGRRPAGPRTAGEQRGPGGQGPGGLRRGGVRAPARRWRRWSG